MEKTWTSEKVNKAYELYQTSNLRVVGKAFGVSRQRVHQIFTKHGLKLHPAHQPRIYVDKEELLALKEENISQVQIAKELNVDVSTVRRMYKRARLKIPTKRPIPFHLKFDYELRTKLIEGYKRDELSFKDIGEALGYQKSSAPPTGRKFILSAGIPLRRKRGQKPRRKHAVRLHTVHSN